MLNKLVAQRVVAAARRFEAAAPWEEFADDVVFAFELPDEPHPIYACVLGAAGREFGLAMYRGERALEQLRLVGTDERPPVVAPMLVLGFAPPRAVAEELRTVATVAGVSDRVMPTFFAVDATRRGRAPRNAELRLMAQVLDAFALADRRDLLHPRAFDPTRACKVLTLRVQSDGKVQDVTARFVAVPAPAGEPAAPAELPWPLGELELADEQWIVGLEPSPVDATDAPVRPELLLVVDAANERLLGLRLVVGDPEDPLDMEEAVRAFAQVCSAPNGGEGRLPERIVVAHRRLHAALAAPLAELGVTVTFVEQHPAVQAALAAFARGSASAPAADATADPADDGDGGGDSGGDAARSRAAAAAAAAPVPDADDEAAWREHRRALERRIIEEMEGADVFSRKALEAFFGDAGTFEALREDGEVPTAEYLPWFAVGYRGKRGRRTVAEKLLAGDLPAAERMLLEAYVGARTGLYRVAEVRPPVCVLSDVLSDYEVEILNGTLAGAVQQGDVLPLRVGDAGGHRFALGLGPQLPAGIVESAIAWLEQQHGTLTSEDLQRQPQRLGSLWTWFVRRRTSAARPRLTNTDGDPLRMLVATFAVADVAALVGAFRERKDVHGDEAARSSAQEDEWTWVQSGGPARGDAEGNTVLAHLELVGGELLVHVNSDARLAAARAWLEQVPGVTFVRVRETELPDPSSAAGAGAGAGAGRRGARRGAFDAELPPEAVEQLQRQIDAACMRWLDESIPALGGRTPREAVRTREGAEQVLRLIRTWPDPSGMRGVIVPRDRMRRELGLDPGATDESGANSGGEAEGEANA